MVQATLAVLAAVVRKSGSPGARWAGTEDLTARLMVLAGGWGGAGEGPDLMACARAEPAGPLSQARARERGGPWAGCGRRRWAAAGPHGLGAETGG